MGKGYPSSDVEANHGYFLTYTFVPAESYQALLRISNHPGAFDPDLGFSSSVKTNHPTKSVSPGYLFQENGLIMAQSLNILKNNQMQNYFSSF